METRKKILIITDEAESTLALVPQLVAAVDCAEVLCRRASEFNVTELLPADGYFFGCECPYPASFVSLERVLQHINLVGRLCGIFSPASEKAVEYLSRMVLASELALYPVPFFADGTENISTWVQAICAGFNEN